MRYTYDVYKGRFSDILSAKRVDTTTVFGETGDVNFDDHYINITDNQTRKVVNHIISVDGWLEWQEKLERDHAWKPKNLEDATYHEHEALIERLSNFNTLKKERAEQEVKDGTLFSEQKKDHINPSHYKEFIDELQWVEVMQKIAHAKNQDFNVFLEYTMRKYFDRRGGKDPSLQEIKKGHWYLRLWEARMKCGNIPVMVDEIDDILED